MLCRHCGNPLYFTDQITMFCKPPPEGCGCIWKQVVVLEFKGQGCETDEEVWVDPENEPLSAEERLGRA